MSANWSRQRDSMVTEGPTVVSYLLNPVGRRMEARKVQPLSVSADLNSTLIPGDGETTVVCPPTAGAKNWLPASYNPDSGILDTSLNEIVHGRDGDGGRDCLSRRHRPRHKGVRP
jgi:hypothetical protein